MVCLYSIVFLCIFTANYKPEVSISDESIPSNFNFPYPDMDVLNALDDAALQRIIQANYEDDASIDYETSYVDPSSIEDVTAIHSNCTETYWNVSLVPRALRKNATYVLVGFYFLRH